MRKLILFFLTGSFFLAGCSESSGEDPTPQPPVPPDEPAKIPIEIAAGLWTRATDSAFELGDKAGIYVVNSTGASAGSLFSTGNHVDNMCFTYSGLWKPDAPIYWKDPKTKADFYGYYPHVSRIANVAAYPFSVKKDQSDESNYKASDFLWGKTAAVAPTSDPVQITLKHVMSNLLIRLEAGKGFNAEELKQARITICGMKTDATIDLATGKATATGGAVDIIPRAEANHYRALVVPQNLTEVDLVKVSIGNHEYILNQTLSFASNKQHTCTLTVDKTAEGIDIGIGGWDIDENDYGGTVGNLKSTL